MILEQVRHWMFALDPIHVGSGREQLTHIDLPHVREKGTGLPVVPGTSLSGSCRAYAALQTGSKCAGKNGIAKDEGGNEKGQCGKCGVCYAFGYSNGDRSRQGVVQIGTAHILFFPVASPQGPVWITCEQQLEDAGLQDVKHDLDPGKYRNAWELEVERGGLDLSWKRLQEDHGAAGVTKAGQFPSRLTYGATGEPEQVGTRAVMPHAVRMGRAAVVSDADFGELVRVNMEVRTLVSINPETGAAKDGALFTYEAIPRGAVLWFDVVYSNPAHYGINKKLDDIENITDQGFTLMKFLGLGGMSTRGMGRVEIAHEREQPKQQ